jgi:hypothetical protein
MHPARDKTTQQAAAMPRPVGGRDREVKNAAERRIRVSWVAACLASAAVRKQIIPHQGVRCDPERFNRTITSACSRVIPFLIRAKILITGQPPAFE